MADGARATEAEQPAPKKQKNYRERQDAYADTHNTKDMLLLPYNCRPNPENLEEYQMLVYSGDARTENWRDKSYMEVDTVRGRRFSREELLKLPMPGVTSSMPDMRRKHGKAG